MTETPAQSKDCRGHIFQFSCWPIRKHSFAFLTILSIFVTVAKQLRTQRQTLASLLADYLANTEQKLTELEVCEPQNKNIEHLHEGHNRTFTVSVDPAEKMNATEAVLPLLKLYAPRNILLVFSSINNSELKARLELDHT